MRDLGEFVLGLDQEYLVDDQVTFRGQSFTCVKFIPRWLKKTPLEDTEHWQADLGQLQQSVSGQFGARFQSTGDAASPAQTRILLRTVGASIASPYLVRFDQLILTPFTGPGQFDLVERDASDVDVLDGDGNYVSGGSSKVTIATKAGFTNGDITGTWSRLVKAITVDKIYSVVFVPGTAGDGIYSIKMSGLNQGQN